MPGFSSRLPVCRYIQPLGLFINNEFVKSSSDDTISVINPTNEEEITSVYAGNAADIDLAVAAARAAFDSPEWSEITPQDRGGLLYKLADLVESNAKILATIGEPISAYIWYYATNICCRYLVVTSVLS